MLLDSTASAALHSLKPMDWGFSAAAALSTSFSPFDHESHTILFEVQLLQAW